MLRRSAHPMQTRSMATEWSHRHRARVERVRHSRGMKITLVRGSNACPLPNLAPRGRDSWMTTWLMIHGKPVPSGGTCMPTWFFRRVRLSEGDSRFHGMSCPGDRIFAIWQPPQTWSRVQRLQIMRSLRLRKQKTVGKRGNLWIDTSLGPLSAVPRFHGRGTAEGNALRNGPRGSWCKMQPPLLPPIKVWFRMAPAGSLPAHTWFLHHREEKGMVGGGIWRQLISRASEFGENLQMAFSFLFFFFFLSGFFLFSAGNGLDCPTLDQSHLVRPPLTLALRHAAVTICRNRDRQDHHEHPWILLYVRTMYSTYSTRGVGICLWHLQVDAIVFYPSFLFCLFFFHRYHLLDYYSSLWFFWFLFLSLSLSLFF